MLFTCENVRAGACEGAVWYQARTRGEELVGRRWVRRTRVRMRPLPPSRTPLRTANEISRDEVRDQGRREFARYEAGRGVVRGLYPRMIPRLSRAGFNVLSGSAPESRGRQASSHQTSPPHVHTYTCTCTRPRTRFREIAHGRALRRCVRRAQIYGVSRNHRYVFQRGRY